jgi:hypothetical protein
MLLKGVVVLREAEGSIKCGGQRCRLRAVWRARVTAAAARALWWWLWCRRVENAKIAVFGCSLEVRSSNGARARACAKRCWLGRSRALRKPRGLS